MDFARNSTDIARKTNDTVVAISGGTYFFQSIDWLATNYIIL